MAPPRSPDPRRNVVRVSLTDAERDELHAWAEAAGMPVSVVVRAALWPAAREVAPNRESRVGGEA